MSLPIQSTHARIHPNFPSRDNNSLKDKPITEGSIGVRKYIPMEQGGTIPLKEISNSPQKGYNRSSLFNLLIQGNELNLGRQNRTILQQENKNVENLVEKKESGL